MAHTAPITITLRTYTDMRLSQFIQQNVEPILVEWVAFARTMAPAQTMSVVAIRDHAQAILLDIAHDMTTAQTEAERQDKSEGLAPVPLENTPAAVHGGLRQKVGFDLNQLGAEFRALRATVLRMWMARITTAPTTQMLEEVNRFNEGIDQAMAESIASYSERMGNSRDTFLAILGHDLRNPLGALRGCLQVLETADTTAERRARSLHIAKRSISSIDEMIRDLLEYTRTRLGRGIEVTPRRGDFGALCYEAFEEVRATHPACDLRWQVSGNDLHADFDAPRMRQVLGNLLRNAVQHGSVDLPVMLHVSDEGEHVSAVIVNYGKPIAPEALQVIFDPLVQLSPEDAESPEPPSTSLGLGLYIAREIINGHNGSITVTSSEADGTAFSLQLPRNSA